MLGASLGVIGAFAPLNAAGQEVIDLGTVIVTGENFERSLRTTASSVTVLSEEEIDARVDAATVDEAIVAIPNVVIPAEYGQGSAPTIRGQDSEGPNSGANAFFGGTTPRATVSLDGHNLSYYELVYSSTPIWDVDSIEVFRGPQTISQGANSIAGAIVINTKDGDITNVTEHRGKCQAADARGRSAQEAATRQRHG